MLSSGRTLVFRTLIIDDDAEMLEALKRRLSGQIVQCGNRRLEPRIDTLCVQAMMTDDGPQFDVNTLSRLIEASGSQYDAIVVDYSYATLPMQTAQWGSLADFAGARQERDCLLTLPDLKSAVVEHDLRNGGRASKRLQNFFDSEAQIILRSLQHDSAKDNLGPFEGSS